jgi:hypothetical protein
MSRPTTARAEDPNREKHPHFRDGVAFARRSMLTSVARAIATLVDTWAEFRVWRSDWNKTWSPASYVLAGLTLLGFCVVLYILVREIAPVVTGAVSR